MPRYKTGTTVNGYTIDKLLGTGGTGEVYKATHPNVPQPIALKVPKAERWRNLFEEEAEHLEVIQHPNIVKFVESFRQDGVPHLAMELVNGKILANLAKIQMTVPLSVLLTGTEKPKSGGLPEATVLPWVYQTLHALEYLQNEHGLYFFTFNLENVMVGADGQLKIVDVGSLKRPPVPLTNGLTLSKDNIAFLQLYFVGIVLYTLLSQHWPKVLTYNTHSIVYGLPLMAGGLSDLRQINSTVSDKTWEFAQRLLAPSGLKSITEALALLLDAAGPIVVPAAVNPELEAYDMLRERLARKRGTANGMNSHLLAM